MGRLVQEKIKQPLAEELLFGKLVNGGEVKVRIKDNAPAFEISPGAAQGEPRPRQGAAPKASGQGQEQRRRRTHGWTGEPLALRAELVLCSRRNTGRIDDEVLASRAGARWRLALRRGARRAPATGPTRSSPAATCSTCRVASRSADQPGRAADRLCPPVQRHHDRPGALDRSGWSTSPAASSARSSPAPAHTFSPRWSPDGKRLAYVSTAEGGAPQLYVRWMDSGESARDHRPARQPARHRLVARRPPHRLFMIVPDEGPKLGTAPAQARGRGMGRRRSRSSTRSPIAPTAPAISSPASTTSSWSPPTAARRAS